MSAFLLVIPEGWTSLDWPFISNNIPSMSKGGVENSISSNMVTDFEPGLKESGLIPLDANIVDAKLIDDTYFLVKLG